MSMKKAKGKSKGTAKKSANKSTPKSKKPVDMVKVRENINDLVTDSAEDIATEVIKVAKTGQLASAKYLFEVVGLYPATEETKAKPQEDSLALTLLRRMGLPTEPGDLRGRSGAGGIGKRREGAGTRHCGGISGSRTRGRARGGSGRERRVDRKARG